MLTEKILDAYGKIGVQAIKQRVEVMSATGKTAASIRYESNEDTLIIYGRKFFETIEKGRGPRKSSEEGGFRDSMYEYMVAKGIGADLPEKKRRQLARFLTLKINKEGDKTFKKGGRNVYSDVVNKLVSELRKALIEDFRNSSITLIKNQLQANGAFNSQTA